MIQDIKDLLTKSHYCYEKRKKEKEKEDKRFKNCIEL